MSQIKDLLEAFSDPQQRHAALSHLPIALGLFGLLLTLVLAFTGGKGRALRWSSLVAFLALVGVAFVTVNSGLAAEGEMGRVAQAAQDRVHEHEEMAEKVWMLGAGVCAVIVIGFFGRLAWLPVASAWVAVGVAAASMGWIATTAHLGGTLVYDFGVGTPNPVKDAPASAGEGGPVFADPRAAFYVRTAQPILESRCYGCHARGDKSAGGLDLSGPILAFRGGDSGPVAIVPGDPAASVVFTSVERSHPDFSMPYKRAKLADEEIEALRRWIAEGAVWPEAQ